MQYCQLAIENLREISLTEEVIHHPSLFIENPASRQMIAPHHLLIYHHYDRRQISDEDECYQLGPDSVFLFYCGRRYDLATPPETYHAWAIHFPLVVGDSFLEGAPGEEGGGAIPQISMPVHLAPTHPQHISGLFDEIVRLWKSAQPQKVLHARGLFLSLLTALPLSLREEEANHDTRIDRVIEHLERNLQEKIVVDALAAQYHISRRTLLAKFKQQTGQTLVSYQTSLRVRQAASLLHAYPDRPLRLIADSLGFCDEFYFSKLFKRWVGHSPQTYRRMSIVAER